MSILSSTLGLVAASTLAFDGVFSTVALFVLSILGVESILYINSSRRLHLVKVEVKSGARTARRRSRRHSDSATARLQTDSIRNSSDLAVSCRAAAIRRLDRVEGQRHEIPRADGLGDAAGKAGCL